MMNISKLGPCHCDDNQPYEKLVTSCVSEEEERSVFVSVESEEECPYYAGLKESRRTGAAAAMQ